MSKFRKLHAPKGTDEANHGTKLYRVDNSGDVLVDDEAVAPLLNTGGFTEDSRQDAIPHGMVRLSAPPGATGCSWGGVEYEVIGGVVSVPAPAAADLEAHGFGAPPAAEAPTTEPDETSDETAAPSSIPKLKIS